MTRLCAGTGNIRESHVGAKGVIILGRRQTYAPIAQRIERGPPEAEAQVRVLLGVPQQTCSESSTAQEGAIQSGRAVPGPAALHSAAGGAGPRSEAKRRFGMSAFRPLDHTPQAVLDIPVSLQSAARQQDKHIQAQNTSGVPRLVQSVDGMPPRRFELLFWP